MTHSHANATIVLSNANHLHTAKNSGLKNCLFAGASSHMHFEGTLPTDLHNHTVEISFSDETLGSPNWWEHDHLITLVSETNGGSNHQHVQVDGDQDCDACLGNPHTHVTGNTGLGGAAHNTHTITGDTEIADITGTPEHHTHPIISAHLVVTASGSHTHTALALGAQACFRGNVHTHTLALWAAKTHLHTGSGTTGDGGEPLPSTGRGAYSNTYILLLPIYYLIEYAKKKRKKKYAAIFLSKT